MIDADPPLVSVLNAAPIPMAAIGPDERIAVENAAFRTLVGRSCAGRHYTNVLRQPRILGCIETVMQGRAADPVVYRTSLRGPEETWMASAARMSGGGVLLSFVDRTDHADVDRIRREFVANVSHELRTPLTALTGFIETLRGPARDDEVARDRFLEIMDRETRRMNRLVRDLLSLGRVEAQERQRPDTIVPLAGCVREAEPVLRAMCDAARLELRITTGDLPLPVAADTQQIGQVLSNLVENAVRYAASGGVVEITLSETEKDPVLRGPSAIVSVRDRGAGIDPVHLPRLTERFYRVDDHRSQDLGGTGLGLAIVKHVIDRHRGRLHISSSAGEGSRFDVILPLHRTDDASDRPLRRDPPG